jgi:probable HAF family extracellular repeat protein
VVGEGNSSAGAIGGNEAFRWTQATGMVGLGDLPGGSFQSDARGVSADGSVVVGYGNSGTGFQAFRWTQATGMVGLGYLPGGSFSSAADGVSADGSVVVGYGNSGTGFQAFRWTQATGMVGLGYLPGGESSGASAVSADGSVVVGHSRDFGFNTQEAFRWTQGTGMVGLGDLPGGDFSSRAYGVSGDGSVVVGLSGGSILAGEAFIWNSSQGMRSLQQVLTNDYGLNLTGWTLRIARAISADGLTVVGEGRNPSGNTEAWIARLDGEPVPPGTTPTNPLLPTPNPSNPNGFIFSGVIVGNNGLGIINPIYFDPIRSLAKVIKIYIFVGNEVRNCRYQQSNSISDQIAVCDFCILMKVSEIF